MRIQAIRASESLYKAGDKTFAADYRAMAKDPDPNVVIQAMLTMNVLHVADAAAVIRATADANGARGIKEIGGQLLRPGRSLGQPASHDTGMGYLNLTPEERGTLSRGEGTYQGGVLLLPRQRRSRHPGGRRAAGDDHGAAAGRIGARPGASRLRHPGPALGPERAGRRQGLRGGAVMVPMGANTDEWVADVANYARNAFGNSGRPFITPDQVAAVRRTAARRTPWTVAALEAIVPVQLTDTAAWSLTASHNADNATNAVADPPAPRWDAGAPEQPGMWFQIELPQVTTVAEVQLDAAAQSSRVNPGLGGLGGLGVATPSPDAGGRGGSAGPGGARGAGAAAGPQRAAAPAGRAGGGGRAGRGNTAPAFGPIVYVAQVSLDGTKWSAPIAQGAGSTPTTVIVSARPTPAKFIRITQTGTATAGEVWGIQRVRVYRTGR